MPLWRLLNTPRSFDPRTARIAIGILSAICTSDAVLRYDPLHPEFFWIRCGIAAWGIPGIYRMPRMSFGELRAYALSVAFVLQLSVGWITAAVGYAPAELALSSACVFVGMVFLQTGADVLVDIVLVAVTQAALFETMPSPSVTAGSVAINIAAAVCAGTATALILIGYRARLEESLQWWRDACERERAARRHKSEFLSTMSHELRSPLHVIIGYTDLLRDELAGALAQPLERIRTSALDLLQLVDHTLQASRLEAGKLTLCITEVDVRRLFDDLVENVATLPEAKRGIPVRWHVPSDLPVLRLDRLKLQEIVQNLVSNALKYTEEGSVTVDVAMERLLLRVDVRDTGPGIPSGSVERIFGMFERVDETLANRPAGVGLGLYIVHGLVAIMGGRITVESVVGRGSCFSVWIPAQAEVASQAA